jgi:hypothetical protein
MPGSLLDELSPMGQDKSLSCCLGARLDSANELGEDDLGRSARSFFSPRRDGGLAVRFCRCRWLERHPTAYGLFQETIAQIGCILPDNYAVSGSERVGAHLEPRAFSSSLCPSMGLDGMLASQLSEIAGA